MAIQKVSGSTIGFLAGVPAIAAGATDAAIAAAYTGFGPYTAPVGCLITGLVIPQRDWEMQQDPVTTCDEGGKLRKSFKNAKIAANGTITGLMDYDEAFIELGYQLQADDVATATYELVHRSGDRVWAQGQVKQFQVDPSDVEGRLQFTFEWVYDEWPEFEGFLI